MVPEGERHYYSKRAYNSLIMSARMSVFQNNARFVAVLDNACGKLMNIKAFVQNESQINLLFPIEEIFYTERELQLS